MYLNLRPFRENVIQEYNIGIISIICEPTYIFFSVLRCEEIIRFEYHKLCFKQGKPEEDDPDSDSVEDLTYRVQTANRKLRHIPLIFVVLYAWGAWQEMAAALSSTASWLVLMQVPIFMRWV